MTLYIFDMEYLVELERQYGEAKKNRDWKTMAAIMLKVYPEHATPPQAKRKAKIKPLQAGA